MNVGGWIIMAVSVGAVVSFFTVCMSLVISNRESAEHMHSPSDIDPHDRDD